MASVCWDQFVVAPDYSSHRPVARLTHERTVNGASPVPAYYVYQGR